MIITQYHSFVYIMELPSEGIYCVARGCNTNSIVSASVVFPHPINLSKHNAEIGVKYIAVTPTWNAKQDMSMIVHDNESDVDTNIKFQPMTDLHEERVLLSIRQQIAAKSPKLLRLVNAPDRKSKQLKLARDVTLNVSKYLAQLLGINEFYESSDEAELIVPILYQKKLLTTTTDIYYLKSEDIASNFFLDNKQDRILELLHISGFETVDFHPQLTYSLVEASLLQKLTFTLYKEDGRPVSSLHTDLYIVCHIRPKHGN